MKEGRAIFVFFSSQERIIERLKEQRDRDDREKTEELDCTKKELKELKERLSLTQGDLSDREARNKQKQLPFALFHYKRASETSSRFFVWICFDESQVPAPEGALSLSGYSYHCGCVSVQTSLLDLKEHASSLASSGLKKDSKLKSLEIALEQKREECLKFESQLKRVQSP